MRPVRIKEAKKTKRGTVTESIASLALAEKPEEDRREEDRREEDRREEDRREEVEPGACSAASVETVYTADEAIMYVTELIMRMRAGLGGSLHGSLGEDVGRPTRVTETEAVPRFKWGDAGLAATTSVRVDFAVARNMRRVCPTSKETHTTSFHALMHADDRTGLLAVYAHCPPCAAKEPPGSRILGGYCFVGFIGEDNEQLLRRSGVFEKAKARIQKLNEDMRKITWQCIKCDEWYSEGERPSMECCDEHHFNDEWICEDCRGCRTPCERWKPPEYW